MAPGTVSVQYTTVGADAVSPLARIADKYGLLFYDSLVSGTRGPAVAGTLVVICAGPEASRERATSRWRRSARAPCGPGPTAQQAPPRISSWWSTPG